jgi:hypothetical protein
MKYFKFNVKKKTSKQTVLYKLKAIRNCVLSMDCKELFIKKAHTKKKKQPNKDRKKK